ncbi:hypothetical protein PybrP1_005423 [[Pythium] brassicae (nom. inval.)]|nr:hypothetical protein PybrP1_005423 [[Pythium] brassicae (nom. inval.)]
MLRRRFWTEKLAVVVDALQLFALLWQLSQPWPWPARWLRATRWTNAFALDAFSFRATGAAMGATARPFSLWGEMRGYALYALLWALLPVGGVALLALATAYWRRAGRPDFLVAAAQLEHALLAAFQVLYVPIGLAVLRLVNCDASGAVSVDPVAMGACWSGCHAAAVVIVTVALGGSFLVGFPLLLRARIRRYLPHPSADTDTDAAAHERFVRSKELEFALGTSETYLELHVPLHASLVRHAAEMPVERCALKLVVLLVFSLLRSPFPSRANQGLQATLVVAALAAFALRRSARTHFRLRSTARLARLVDWGLVANGMLALLSANGVRSALTVASTMASCLVAVNASVAFAVVLLLLRSAREWTRRDGGAGADGFADAETCCWWWPVPDEEAEATRATTTGDARKQSVELLSTLSSTPNPLLLRQWVDAIMHAKAVCLNALLTTPSMRSGEELDAALERLAVCHAEALHAKHLLADQLSEMVASVNEMRVDALTSNPYHKASFPADSQKGSNKFDAGVW